MQSNPLITDVTKGLVGGLESVLIKKNLSSHVIEANNKTWFGEQLKYQRNINKQNIAVVFLTGHRGHIV